MTALKASEVDAFVARPDPRYAIVLVFGPDGGAVSERADALLRASVDDVNDPFAMTRLDGDDIAADPAKLADAALTVPLFGGRRAVSVRLGARSILPAVEPLLALDLKGCRIVIEAGDLKRNAPLRAAVERAKSAVALPCYADDEKALARLIDMEMAAAGLTIAPEARATLIPLLGGDRRASRGEVLKLATYAQGKGRVEVDDVMAVIADAAALAVDAVVDAAFAGKPKELETHFARALAGGTSPGTIVFAALQHAANLHKAKLEGGGDASAELRAMRAHFKREGAARAALKAWSEPRLAGVIESLGVLQFQSRAQAALAATLTHRALLQLAMQARGR
ncbi:MAG: DNA polymerase III subunit delta [Variibacter sp.]